MKKAIAVSSNREDGHFSPIDASGNSFIIKEWTGSGPEYLHIHYEDDEAWHILEGTLTFKFNQDELKEYGPGTTVFVPAGIPHTYFESNGATRYLIILTSRLDKLIRKLHSTPLERHSEVLKRYKSEIIDPCYSC